MLADTFYGDGDRFPIETLAEKLAAAMRAHLEGRGDEAGREADAVASVDGDPPRPASSAADEIRRSGLREWLRTGIPDGVELRPV